MVPGTVSGRSYSKGTKYLYKSLINNHFQQNEAPSGFLDWGVPTSIAELIYYIILGLTGHYFQH